MGLAGVSRFGSPPGRVWLTVRVRLRSPATPTGRAWSQLSADVVEHVGCRFASEPVRRDEARVALARAGELIVVPALRGKRKRSCAVAQAATSPAAEERR
jgi:hypothetical protein